MKVKLNAKKFNKKLKEISKFIASGNTDIPITKGIMITAKGEYLILDASNFIHGCKSRIKTNIIEEGRFVVEGKKFIKLIKSFSGDKITLKLEGHKLKMTDDSSDYNSFTMLTLNGPDKFPTLPTPGKDANKIRVKRDEFINTISKVGFAADDPKLADINKKKFSKMIFFTEDLIYATNTQKFGAVTEHNFDFSLHLPKDSHKYFKNLSKEFNLYIEDDIYYVQDGNLFFMVKIESCKPPEGPIRKILKEKPEKKVVYDLSDYDRKRIISALRQLKILNEYVVAYITDSTLWLSGIDYENSAKNEFHTSIKGINIQPKKFKEEVKVTYSIRNLIQALTSTNEPTLIFQGSYDEDKAFVRVFEDNFQAVIQKMIGRHEERIVEKIIERRDNNRD